MNKNKINSQLEEKFSILIIDDERDTLSTIADTLKDDQYLLHLENNPQTALSRIETQHFDVVITDLIMPEISGMDIVSAVNNISKDTLVIVLTGHANLETAIASLQLGVYDYVNKPVDPSELKNILKRATEKIALERRNRMLHQNNERILSNLSLLFEISKILYQVTDLDSVMEMILDTMTEYFKFSNSAVLMEDMHNGKYKISASKNLSAGYENLEFYLPDKINNSKISTEKETIFYIENFKLKTTRNTIQVKQNGWILLTPVNFQDQVLGFLLIQSDSKSDFPAHETVTMLNILASQAAPVIYALGFKPKEKPIENNLVYMIREKINQAKEVLSPITFALCRLELCNPAGDEFIFQDMIQCGQKIINDNVHEPFELFWRTQDTALIIMPEMDYFKAETFCKKIKNLTDNYFVESNPQSKLILSFTCVGYPEEGDTASDITDHLWAKLFQEMNFSKNELHNNHIES